MRFNSGFKGLMLGTTKTAHMSNSNWMQKECKLSPQSTSNYWNENKSQSVIILSTELTKMLKRQQTAGPSARDTVSHHTSAMIFFFGTSVWSMVKTSWGQQFVGGFGTNWMRGSLGKLYKNWMQKIYQRIQIFCIINFLYYSGGVSFQGEDVLQQ